MYKWSVRLIVLSLVQVTLLTGYFIYEHRIDDLIMMMIMNLSTFPMHMVTVYQPLTGTSSTPRPHPDWGYS